jgi:hypothetical protein
MPFVKLDCGILNSTLWHDPDALKLFVTALLMAEPHELVEPTPTLAVDSLEPGGYTVPPGWYGLVASSGIGLIYRALMQPTEGFDALSRLIASEGVSRSQDHEGRRLARIDGGFLILNYQKYRDRDYSNAERQARFRARKRQAGNTVTITPVTQAEAEAEADKKENSFGQFWNLYPRKVGKPNAYKAWSKLSPDEHAAIVKAIPGWPFSPDVQFIPHPATWLNGRRWEDVLTPSAPVAAPDPVRRAVADRNAAEQAATEAEIRRAEEQYAHYRQLRETDPVAAEAYKVSCLAEGL